MKYLSRIVLLTAVILGLSLGGCVYVPARGAGWVPGHWAGYRHDAWVPGHYR